jgi:hypothetical protein
MEFFGIILGVLFWPPVIAIWILLCRFCVLPRGIKRGGLVVLVGLPCFAAFSVAKYLFLDEPMVIAIRAQNPTEAKRLIALGASPNANFEGLPALEQAAGTGQADVVRLLIARGADLETQNSWNKHTALQSALAGKHTEVASLLRKASAHER